MDNFIITFSESALTEMKSFAEAEGTNYFRISVMPGGCSGFKYNFEVIDNPEQDDIVVEQHNGVKAVVDPFSVQYLNNVVVDYVSNMMESGFKFNNPNASGGCGCGTSFAV
jgi:iron-sulfur cluster insertion protein